MEKTLRSCADQIVEASIRAVLPDEAVRRALKDFHPEGRTVLVAAGKAAWQMAHAAVAVLGHVDGGVVVTKYDHVKGKIPGVTCCEAGHPVPDANSFAATQKALELVQGLQPEDTVLFLLSGGGSALFEKPLIPAEELQDITSQLLASGADIVEMNTIRKRLSGVKGGRFAQACAPAQVFSIVLSDILGDPLDMIASGPAVPDTSTCGQAIAIAEKYRLRLSIAAQELLRQETPQIFYVSDLAWLASYVFLLALTLTLADPEERQSRTGLCWLAPVFCLPQFALYATRGDLLLNVLMCGLTMMLAWCAMRGLVWAKKTENGRLRRFHGTVLAFTTLEYALWTASCFWVSDTLTNPYFWFDFLLTLVLLLFLPAVRKAVEA